MISVQSLTKRYGSVLAVDGIDFEVGKGEIVGFIGPNGAGKTTTMRMLTGFIPATDGTATVAGFDVFDEPMSVRRSIGYLPETPPLYTELTIGQYLMFVAEVREVPRRERLGRMGLVMEQVGLSGWEDRILGSLSKGYRQRVGLAQAIIHDPKVLILDEPTSGLDPKQMVGIREFIRGLALERTVILSTHILSEVEALCERAILIDGGRIKAADTLDGLRARVGAGVRYRIEIQTVPNVNLAAAVGALDVVDQVAPAGETDGFVGLDVRASEDPRTAIASLVTEKGWQIRAMERHMPNLEEAFLHLVEDER
ncbi:MAG: MFS transporter [Deltaproteobacteria bacterium]|nr:MFS transporter [Deltaproteobacteria bacterium]